MAATHFPVFLDLTGRRCVVVGAGRIAEDKISGLLEAQADLTVIAPAVCPAVETWAKAGALRLLRRPYRVGDLAGAVLAIAATADPALNRQVHLEGERGGVLVNVVDHPTLCHYLTPSVLRRGPLTVAISTAGVAPALAALVRRHLERLLDASLGRFLERAVFLRRQIGRREPDPAARRHAWYALLRQALPHLLAGQPRSGSGRAWQALRSAERPAQVPARHAPGHRAARLGVVSADLLATPLEALERLVVAAAPGGPLGPALAALRDRKGRPLLQGWLLAPSSERVDLLYETRLPRLAARAVEALLRQAGALDPDAAGALRPLHDEAAVAHLFAVAAGLRAVAPGDASARGPLREALDGAGLGAHLTQALHEVVMAALAFAVTRPAAHPAVSAARNGAATPSLGSLAVAWLRERVPGADAVHWHVEGDAAWCGTVRTGLARFGLLPPTRGDATAGAGPRDVVLLVRHAEPGVLHRHLALRHGSTAGRLWMLDAGLPRSVPPQWSRQFGVTLWTLDALLDGLPPPQGERETLGAMRAAAEQAAEACWARLASGAAAAPRSAPPPSGLTAPVR